MADSIEVEGPSASCSSVSTSSCKSTGPGAERRGSAGQEAPPRATPRHGFRFNELNEDHHGMWLKTRQPRHEHIKTAPTCSARRSGENQKPLYTSSAYRGMMSSCNCWWTVQWAGQFERRLHRHMARQRQRWAGALRWCAARGSSTCLQVHLTVVEAQSCRSTIPPTKAAPASHQQRQPVTSFACSSHSP